MTRRAFKSLKNRIATRPFLAGKVADTPSSAAGPATVHDAAIQVVDSRLRETADVKRAESSLMAPRHGSLGVR